jgi:hypothetical protein
VRPMGYDLTNSAGDRHHREAIAWSFLLNIATRYGWQPGGTDYFKHAAETVRAADASALASAVESFFNDVCRDEIAGEVAERMQEVIDGANGGKNAQRFAIFTEPVEQIRSMPAADRNIRAWRFGEQECASLPEFIAFCRKGAFTIR